jgi:hypothetical protein
MPLTSFFRSRGVQFVVTFPEAPLSGPHGPTDQEKWAALSAERRRAGTRSSHAA